VPKGDDAGAPVPDVAAGAPKAPVVPEEATPKADGVDDPNAPPVLCPKAPPDGPPAGVLVAPKAPVEGVVVD
jgi:hypothetical protein